MQPNIRWFGCVQPTETVGRQRPETNKPLAKVWNGKKRGRQRSIDANGLASPDSNWLTPSGELHFGSAAARTM